MSIFIYIHTLCMRVHEAKALMSLRNFADSSEPSLLDNVISPTILCSLTFRDCNSLEQSGPSGATLVLIASESSDMYD